MQFTIPRQQINQAMNIMLKAISNKVPIPILEDVKIEVAPKQMKLTTSNDDITLNQTIVPEKGEDDFSDQEIAFVVPARFLAKVIKSFKGRKLTFDITDKPQIVTVSSGKAHIKIPYLQAKLYPKLPDISQSESVAKATISAKTMQTIIKQDLFAVSQDQIRMILNGLHLFYSKSGQLISEGTDSHRLSYSKIDSAQVDDQFKKTNVVIPADTMKRLAGLVRALQDEDQIEIIHFGDLVCFKFANLIVFTKLYSGEYPETSRLIPTQSDTTLVFDRKQMLDSINRAILTASKNHNPVVELDMEPPTKDDRHSHVVLSTSTIADSHASTTEELTDVTLSDKPLEICFNPGYLKQALQAFDSDQIKLSFTQPLRPFVATDPDNDEQFVHLITPIRKF